MRKRRRAKFIWMPQLGTQGDSEDLDNVGFVLPTLNFPTTSAGQVGDVFITPLIPDEPKETAVALGDNLADFTQNEYFLKRIVGKLQWGFEVIDPNSVTQAPARIIVAAGFFVARSEAGGSQLPIGASTSADARINYGPLNQTTTREPWIWRRSWIFDGQARQTEFTQPPGGGTGNVFGGITDTRQYAALGDGGHIDAKTARRIKSDERLFFALQGGNAVAVDGSAGSVVLGGGWLDVRVLGQMRKPRSRGVF